MVTMPRADVVIVGAGWTGLVMAKEIATRTSLSVVVLERGGQVRTTAQYAAGMDELDFEIRLRMKQNIAEQPYTHRRSPNEAAKPVRQWGAYQQGIGVGGEGEAWSGVSPRFMPEQFELASHLRRKYGSRLPEGLSVQDWGCTYDELEPYYWRAEQMLGLSGKAGNLGGKKIPGGNIFEGPRSHEYPLPPHPYPYFATLFEKGALDLGYHPFPLPAATPSGVYTNPDGVTRPPCQYCGHCGYYGCMVGAKATPSTTMLPILRTRKNATLRINSWVRRVVHRDGKAQGVAYQDAAGKEVMQPADVVVLSSWSMNNVSRLLLSGIGDPYDPHTGKGTLGKNFTTEVGGRTEVFLDKPLNGFIGGGAVGNAIGDLVGDVPDADVSAGVFRGGLIRTILGGQSPIRAFGRVPQGEVKSNWGAEWKKAGLKWYDRQLSMNTNATHFAYRQNYLDLDPTYTDKWGDPVLRVTMNWTDHEVRQSQMLGREQQAIAKAMGAKASTFRGNQRPYDAARANDTHVHGGAIMGTSPETSVVNPYLQHWKMPNLWVVGGSCFPQNESNPTLTLLALTYRAMDALIDRYIKKPGALA
jgi:gluconate 2-dehydrogenase alpha chain